MRILIIRLSSIGDILLATPFIRQTHLKYPEAKIDFVVKKNFVELVQFNPHIQNIYELETDNDAPLPHLAKQLNKNGYRFIFDLHNNFRSIYLRYAVSAHKKYWIHKNKWQQFLLIKLKHKRRSEYKSIPDRYLSVGIPAGIKDDGQGLEIYWDKQTDISLHAKIEEAVNYPDRGNIGLAPGAGFYTKRWPVESFVRLVELLNEHKSYNIFIIGGEKEEEIGGKLATQNNVINFTGKLNLLESANLISQLNMLISNDSGMMHMATAVKTPVLAIFGSSVRELGFAPYRSSSFIFENENLQCRPCSHIGKNYCPEKHFKCMKDITPNEVYQKIVDMV